MRAVVVRLRNTGTNLYLISWTLLVRSFEDDLAIFVELEKVLAVNLPFLLEVYSKYELETSIKLVLLRPRDAEPEEAQCTFETDRERSSKQVTAIFEQNTKVTRTTMMKGK